MNCTETYTAIVEPEIHDLYFNRISLTSGFGIEQKEQQQNKGENQEVITIMQAGDGGGWFGPGYQQQWQWKYIRILAVVWIVRGTEFSDILDID